MQLSENKSKLMIVNFTKNFQFSTRAKLNNTLLDIVDHTMLLGTVVSNNMTWHKNTEYLVKRGYQRMTIIRKLYEFDIPREDLVLIYHVYQVGTGV